MNTSKVVITIAALLLGALLMLGAKQATEQRPPNIAEEAWIPLGEKAGFFLKPNSTDTRYAVVVQLYIKTDGGWRRASIENNVYVTPLDPSR